MRTSTLIYIILIAGFVLAPVQAGAEEWVVTKLRGNAAVLVGEKWEPLRRGDKVADDSAVQTLERGRMTLQRGAETVEIGSQTAIRIDDASSGEFTTVKQYFGTVVVEAEVQNVQHFGVLTPHLAAVVKGTRFTVASDANGASVDVERGSVAVRDGDTGQTTTLGIGQSAATSEGAPLTVYGEGVLPTVFGANGTPLRASAPSDQIVSPAAAAERARQAALEAGATTRQADRAAKAAEKEAAKEAKEEAKAAQKEARSEEKAADRAGKSESKSGDNGNSSKGPDGNSGKGSDGSDNGQGHNKSDDGGGSSGNANGNGGGNSGNGGGGGNSDSGSDGNGGGNGNGGSGGEGGGGGGGKKDKD